MNFDITQIIFMVPALLFAVIIHEIAHGLVAYKLGDPTAKMSGRLTFNPIPHIDPVGSIILPAILIFTHSPILFGWAKPVPINPIHFKKLGYRKGMAVTALAGPLSNLIFAVIFGIMYQILRNEAVLNTLASIGGVAFIKSIILPILLLLQYSVTINVILAIFNLIPIPPLDGGRILMSLASPQLEQKLQPLEQYGFIIVIVLLLVGVLNFIIFPPYRFLVSVLLGT